MLKLGKLYHFNIKTKSWTSNATAVQFNIEDKCIGEGSFRQAFTATSSTPQYAGRLWVVKKLLPSAMCDIKI